MIVIAIIGILAAALFPAITGYIERARVAGIHGFVTSIKAKWEILGYYNYETINPDGSIPNLGYSSYNLLKANPRSGEPPINVTWSSWLPWLWQAWDYNTASYTITDSALPLSGSNFYVMHWIRSTSLGWQTYTILNTWDQNWFRFGISGGKLQILTGTPSSVTEVECGFAKNINDGLWHHIGAYFDYTNGKVHCYYDGKEVGSVTVLPTDRNFWDKQVFVGNGLYSAFTGSLDDVYIIKEF